MQKKTKWNIVIESKKTDLNIGVFLEERSKMEPLSGRDKSSLSFSNAKEILFVVSF